MIKASVFIMAILIVAGLVAIAAKLVLDLGESSERAGGGKTMEQPRVVHMVGAGDRVIFVIEDPSQSQTIRILDPLTGSVSEMTVEELLN